MKNDSSDIYFCLCSYCDSLAMKSSILIVNSFGARKQLTKFRTSNHDLAIEKGGHAKLERHMRTYTMCDLGCVEDDCHFILICPKYDR